MNHFRSIFNQISIFFLQSSNLVDFLVQLRKRALEITRHGIKGFR